ncbi:hypothetical protein AtNW77_Chr4g0280901 [Arabidopsis thaliana]
MVEENVSSDAVAEDQLVEADVIHDSEAPNRVAVDVVNVDADKDTPEDANTDFVVDDILPACVQCSQPAGGSVSQLTNAGEDGQVAPATDDGMVGVDLTAEFPDILVSS